MLEIVIIIYLFVHYRFIESIDQVGNGKYIYSMHNHAKLEYQNV